MPCKILEIVSPLPVAGTIAASETFSWSDFVDYVHPESVFGTGSGISWEFQAINQQTGQKYTAAVTGPNGSDGPSGSDSPIGDTWPDGYYRIHVVYTDPNGLKHNMEKHPIFWNKSIISWMSYVAPGSFMCGSPADEIGRSSSPAETQHKCTLTSGFYIARTAMTCTFFRALMTRRSQSQISRSRQFAGPCSITRENSGSKSIVNGHHFIRRMTAMPHCRSPHVGASNPQAEPALPILLDLRRRMALLISSISCRPMP